MRDVYAERIRGIVSAWRIMALGFALLAARLFYVCVARGPSLAVRAVEQRSSVAVIHESRGVIYDRRLAPLAGGDSAATPGTAGWDRGDPAVAVFPALISGPDGAMAQLAEVLPDARTGARVIRLSDRDYESVSRLAHMLSGVIPLRIPRRYSEQGLAAHVVGYVSGKGIGADGIEASFDWALAGPGAEVVRVMCDANGTEIPGLGARLAVVGGTKTPGGSGSGPAPGGYSSLAQGAADGTSSGGWVRLAIHSELQRAAEQAFDRRAPGMAGAIVAMDPYSGEILAMVSRPAYDQNDVGSQLARRDAPMLNRALRPYYPGSVFKVVIAAAALAGVTTPATIWSDPGYAQVGERQFRCHAYDRGGHGDISFAEALAQSCNTVFIEAARATGAKEILDTARALGIGSSDTALAVRLPNAASGRLPGRAVSGAELANLALGQAVVEITPLEAAVMMSVVANGGTRVTPVLVLEACSADGRRVAPGVSSEIVPGAGSGISPGTSPGISPAAARSAAGQRVLDSEVARDLTAMLSGVVSHGTAHAALGELDAAGKTGTAQTGRVSDHGDPLYNAWFAGFAPVAHPVVAIAVLVEGPGSGADMAAPIFGEVCRKALELGL